LLVGAAAAAEAVAAVEAVEAVAAVESALLCRTSPVSASRPAVAGCSLATAAEEVADYNPALALAGFRSLD